jgi:hypothetical protein
MNFLLLFKLKPRPAILGAVPQPIGLTRGWPVVGIANSYYWPNMDRRWIRRNFSHQVSRGTRSRLRVCFATISVSVFCCNHSWVKSTIPSYHFVLLIGGSSCQVRIPSILAGSLAGAGGASGHAEPPFGGLFAANLWANAYLLSVSIV